MKQWLVLFFASFLLQGDVRAKIAEDFQLPKSPVVQEAEGGIKQADLPTKIADGVQLPNSPVIQGEEGGNKQADLPPKIPDNDQIPKSPVRKAVEGGLKTAALLLKIADNVQLPKSPVLQAVEGGIKQAAQLFKDLVPGIVPKNGGDRNGKTTPTEEGGGDQKNVGQLSSQEPVPDLGTRHGGDHGGKSMSIGAGSQQLSKVGHRHHRRPFFVIGHMVNSREEVDQYLARGSNALESDIEFDQNGTVLGTFHGTPCDCFRGCFKREKMADFLEHVRNVTSLPHSKFRGQMILLFLDLKTAKLPDNVKVRAGVTLAKNLMDHLWKGVPHRDRIHVLMSIGYARDRDVIRGAVEYFRQKGDPRVLEKLGFDVGMNDPLDIISRMYKRLGIRKHRWQGDGLTNCMRFLMPVDRLLKAIRWRNSKKGYMDKVYHWTIDLPYFIIKSIKHGVDGIITNRPENVRKVVESAMFRDTLKVADTNDSPWTRFYESPEDVREDTDTAPMMLGGE